uniref:tRNA wybutosine-synthesizing protein 4 n=1 Tax=Sinocyclocheilus rhinocerous TaxID=307959 RepID=A0A673I7K9_9TELE
MCTRFRFCASLLFPQAASTCVRCNASKQQERVQGTNDSSVVSKVSAAAQGYFHDDFLKHFVCKVSRRAPLINRGYYVRWKAVDHCLKQFFHATQSCSRRQILSLGAGFDSLYFRLHAEGALGGVTVFEVDFPEVARRKAALINSNTCLKDMLPDRETVSNQSGHYNLIGVDVRKEQEVEVTLSGAGLQWDAPTLVLSEVVLTYMETQWSDAVIGWAAKLLPQSVFVMYEQIHPDDPFGRVMQNHFLKLNSTIHALKQYPDTVAQTQRFIQKGWEKCVCLDMNQFYFDLLLEDERQRVEGLEPFDEPLSDSRITTQSDLMPDPRPVFIFMITGMEPEMFPLLHPYSLQRLCDQSSTSHASEGDFSLVVFQNTFLFVFGGRTEKDPVLGDAHFLWPHNVPTFVCFNQMTVVGAVPEARHSHSACPYGGGLVIFGGLGKGGRPICDAFYLRPTLSGFCWETMNLHPPPVPRYSHSAHVINEKLVVVGGVWLQADGVPGVAVINLSTGSCVEIQLDTSSVPWPLMLHSFCSELLDSEGSEMVLIGGGGNCFSFGTHLNLHPITVDLRP